MFIIIGVYLTAVNVTEMNAEYDQSGACLKDPGKMSWHKNQLVNCSGCVTPTTMSCISSKDLIIPPVQSLEQLSLSDVLLWCACR